MICLLYKEWKQNNRGQIIIILMIIALKNVDSVRVVLYKFPRTYTDKSVKIGGCIYR